MCVSNKLDACLLITQEFIPVGMIGPRSNGSYEVIGSEGSDGASNDALLLKNRRALARLDS